MGDTRTRSIGAKAFAVFSVGRSAGLRHETVRILCFLGCYMDLSEDTVTVVPGGIGGIL